MAMMINHYLVAAIKQRMEKDIDEVGKIARLAKAKVEELDRDVCCFLKFLVLLSCIQRELSP